MKEFDKLVEIVAKLRSKNGCDWDKKQTLNSMKKYILEESYELFDAIDSSNLKELQEEIGDITMHMVFLSQIATENNFFHINEVLNTINTKLINRHPHVFGNTKVENVDDILKNWEEIKKKEKKERKNTLDGIPKAFPSILRAMKIQEKLTRVGFDWPEDKAVLEKIDEELLELKEAFSKRDKENISEEIGDLIFTIVNFASRMNLDAEEIMQNTNDKIINRFSQLEEQVKSDNKNIEELSLEELDSYWNKIKNLN